MRKLLFRLLDWSDNHWIELRWLLCDMSPTLERYFWEKRSESVQEFIQPNRAEVERKWNSHFQSRDPDEAIPSVPENLVEDRSDKVTWYIKPEDRIYVR